MGLSALDPEGSYDVLGDLGEKRVGQQNAHGYRLTLKNQEHHGDKDNVLRDPIELWVDPKTELPVEISWSGESEGYKYADITDDFRWNAPLDKRRFEPDIPPDYADITPPTEQQDLDQIVAALRLFAQLSGGHYPGGRDLREKKFNPRRIHDGMLKMADSSTAADPARARKSTKKSKRPWLDSIGSRSRYPQSIPLRLPRPLGWPTDKDQVLLWCLDPASDGYRVFYGDLRTEVVTEQQKSKLVPKHEVVGEPQSE